VAERRVEAPQQRAEPQVQELVGVPQAEQRVSPWLLVWIRMLLPEDAEQAQDEEAPQAGLLRLLPNPRDSWFSRSMVRETFLRLRPRRQPQQPARLVPVAGQRVAAARVEAVVAEQAEERPAVLHAAPPLRLFPESDRSSPGRL
jgi:hypothetical protein